jgi:hypothetical protein
MNELRGVFLKILEVINYTEDKEDFIKEFEKNIKIQTVFDLVRSLPNEKQDELKKRLIEVDDNPEKIVEILKEYFSADKIQEEIKNITKNSFSEYIETILPTLSASQTDSLQKILEEVATPPLQTPA